MTWSEGRFDGLDWDNLEQVSALVGSALEELSEQPEVILRALAEAREDAGLRDLCEHYDILDKVVLHDDAGGLFRLRLHVFRPGYFDRPHNHRWTYVSRILAGAYTHFIYGGDAGLHESTDVSVLQPQMVRVEKAGAGYTLDHGVVHSVVAEPWTVSLIVRGPARKDSFVVMDKETGSAWRQYGAKHESPEDRAAKRMTDAQLGEVASVVRDKLGQSIAIS